ncbi:MAG: glycerophosphodiester phosphodiesterase family protein [Neomegalonema sp.]|nr:glycerophosphodiester phosphodiesterase family protein [Neomegalonema sp.]
MASYRKYIERSDRRCAVVAHRGAWRRAPENSVAALREAAALGVSIVETDVRRSLDGMLIIHHDDSLRRMTGLDRPPEALEAAELTALRLFERAGGAACRPTRETLPSLAALLRAASEAGVYLDLDVKREELIEEVAAAAAAQGAAEIVDVKLSLHSDEAVERAERIRRGTSVEVMAKVHFDDALDETLLRRLDRLRPFMVEATAADLDALARWSGRMAEIGAAVWVNSLDFAMCCDGMGDRDALEAPEAVWGALIEAGVSAIQTDRPEALLCYLAERDGLSPTG